MAQAKNTTPKTSSTEEKPDLMDLINPVCTKATLKPKNGSKPSRVYLWKMPLSARHFFQYLEKRHILDEFAATNFLILSAYPFWGETDDPSKVKRTDKKLIISLTESSKIKLSQSLVNVSIICEDDEPLIDSLEFRPQQEDASKTYTENYEARHIIQNFQAQAKGSPGKAYSNMMRSLFLRGGKPIPEESLSLPMCQDAPGFEGAICCVRKFDLLFMGESETQSTSLDYSDGDDID